MTVRLPSAVPPKEHADEASAYHAIHQASHQGSSLGASPLPPEAATPHAPLSPAMVRAFSMVPITASALAFEQRRGAPESWDTCRAALPKGRSMACMLWSSASDGSRLSRGTACGITSLQRFVGGNVAASI